MKHRAAAVVIIVLLAGALLWLLTSRKVPPPAQLVYNNPSTTTESARVSPASFELVSTEETPKPIEDSPSPDPTENAPTRAKGAARAMPLATSSAPEVGPGLSPALVLENMRSMFRNYSSRFGGNPVGNNLEITSVLNGANPAQAVFLNPEDGLRISDRGELVDHWNTPYFFHQLSRTEMEIHSAGPDRRMWTSDDLVIK